jgi:hypothetical protein
MNHEGILPDGFENYATTVKTLAGNDAGFVPTKAARSAEDVGLVRHHKGAALKTLTAR